MTVTNWIAPEVAIIVPTFCERENITPLLGLLRTAMGAIPYEVVFVDDDSPDGTAAFLRCLAQRDPYVRVVHRVGRRGLASACLEGMLASSAPYIALLDADLQHDESILPSMLERIKKDKLDVVIATRNSGSGSMGAFAPWRIRLSNLGKWLSQWICRASLSDPMSGFFIIDRKFLQEVVHSSSAVGFKILLDLVSSSRRPVRFAEIPYTFRNRLYGQSKLDVLVGLEYLLLILDKMVGSWVPPRYILFNLVGTVGVAVHLAVLQGLRYWGGWEFYSSHFVASLVAMTINFGINNLTTYRDLRLQGVQWLLGLLKFYLGCSIGMALNLQLTALLIGAGWRAVPAALAGLAAGSVWNFRVSSYLAWRQKLRKASAAGNAQANAWVAPQIHDSGIESKGTPEVSSDQPNLLGTVDYSR